MEGAELGVFMISAALFVALLYHPASPAVRWLPNEIVRRVLTGIAMGLTASAIVYSPWGKQSGAHFNPCVTLTFWRLGKTAGWDAIFYIAAQFAGAVAGVLVAATLLGELIRHPSVNYVATLPGASGTSVAFVAELLISFGLMSVVLIVSNRPSVAWLTGVCCGAMVATYISIEAPLSGMSMNPARSFGPAAASHMWSGFWVYCVAPPFGMLAAAETHVRCKGTAAVACAKLHHENDKRCIFCGKAGT